jgi:hypothetical protein
MGVLLLWLRDLTDLHQRPQYPILLLELSGAIAS